MRSLFVFILCCSLYSFCQAQYQSPSFNKGQSTIAVAHGIGNFWRELFNFTIPPNGGSYDVSSTGPYSLVYEYGFSNRISAGIALGYSSISAVYKYQGFRNDEKFTNYAVLARGNYHFGKVRNFDPYIGIGAGYFNFNYTSKDNSGSATPGTGVKVPGAFGYSGVLGGKYYFFKSIAAIAEVGYVAGSYAQAGLSARF